MKLTLYTTKKKKLIRNGSRAFGTAGRGASHRTGNLRSIHRSYYVAAENGLPSFAPDLHSYIQKK